MPLINVTPADLKKLELIESNWYGAEIVRVMPAKASDKGDSVNYPIDFLIEKTGGKEIPVLFNTKLIGKIGALVEAVTGKKFDGGQFDTDTLLNKKVDVKVGARIWEGNMLNEITAYLPYGKGQGQTQPF
jgi:hypothetical protein